MGQRVIPRLVISSPYVEPAAHWRFDRDTNTWEKVEGRRRAGYLVAAGGDAALGDMGDYQELPLANQIRDRVRQWREAGYPGATGTTRRLLRHWYDKSQRVNPFFFCQLEAIETLIFLTEAPPSLRTGLPPIPRDGGDFSRLCSKMATGTGKTIVMGLVIAWQVLNKAALPERRDFTRNILVIAPSITVRNRLVVLEPSDPRSIYDEYGILPPGSRERFMQAKVVVHNWHLLQPVDTPKIGKARRGGASRVLKHLPEGAEAFSKRVLGEIGRSKNILVINDEAHHCWRVDPKSTSSEVEKEIWDPEEATIWVEGLDRIHRARGIMKVLDFTATPFAPTGKRSGEETLFGWVVSDFGLNDAIESGLVKTPRLVIRDDTNPDAEMRSRFYAIYRHVRDQLGPRAGKDDILPDLVRNAYLFLSKDWLETERLWRSRGESLPPVMITVANNVRTSERIERAFAKREIGIEGFYGPDGLLRIDSGILNAPEGEGALAEADEGGELTQAQQQALVRRRADTVGKRGSPGENIRNVVSVAMLSEGWDCRNVTDIMGLRAFTSQLLCEQVIGRGLRRMSYELEIDGEYAGMFKPEYVNVFGVPFSFLPLEGDAATSATPTPPTTIIQPMTDRVEYEVRWPNIERVQPEFGHRLTLDHSMIAAIRLDPTVVSTHAQLGALMDGRPNLDARKDILLRDLADGEYRLQRTIFLSAKKLYDRLEPSWLGNTAALLGQVVGLVEGFISSDKVDAGPIPTYYDEVRRRILLALNVERIVNHVWHFIVQVDSSSLCVVFDEEKPIMSTSEVRPWQTRRPTVQTVRSHLNRCVVDSGWEASASFPLDAHPAVAAWVKNDHLGFVIKYLDRGEEHPYTPDFIVRMTDGRMLILEVKGQKQPEDQAKWNAAADWVKAVNENGSWGSWGFASAEGFGEVHRVLDELQRTTGKLGPSAAPTPEKSLTDTATARPSLGGQVSFGKDGKLKGTASLKNWKK